VWLDWVSGQLDRELLFNYHEEGIKGLDPRIDLNRLMAYEPHLSVHKGFDMNTDLLLGQSEDHGRLNRYTVWRLYLHSECFQTASRAFFSLTAAEFLEQKHPHC
jgi:hypothetical protein